MGINIPDGFILDVDVFDEIISFNGIEEDVLYLIDELKNQGKANDADTKYKIKAISKELLKLFENIALPEDIACKINTFIKDDVK